MVFQGRTLFSLWKTSPMYRVSISCVHCHKAFLALISQVGRESPCSHCGMPTPFPSVPTNEAKWFLAVGKKKVGPLSRAQLAELAVSQQLHGDDMVLLDGANKWQEANSITGLFTPIPDELTPKLVTDPPISDSSDVFSNDTSAFTPKGPLSLKGIKVRVNFSLTLGDFQIFRKLGAGGMGAIYLAQQRSLDRHVALKVLSESHADKETFVNRFHREAAILASLNHANIVQFLGAGQERGLPFFAMEFIDGFSTAALVKQMGKLAVGDALHIIRRSAEAMTYALENKIVHRDIKPENIMITRLGAVKIADLGLAKSLDNQDLDLTDTGTALGSPKYMAPEQSRNAKLADHRSDIYALGGVLYYLLTAEEPFKGATAVDLLLAKEQKIFVPARRLNQEVPPRLDLIIDKMLAKSPAQRYQTYADLLRDLAILNLTNERLSFDSAAVMPAGQDLPAGELVEILLIDNDFDDVRLAKQALEENHIASNLIVVNDGAEARAFLRREGKFLFAPPPNLIFFGGQMDCTDTLLTLEEIKLSETLSRIPLILLAKSPEAAQFFESRGYTVKMIANLQNSPDQFQDLFKAAPGLCLTMVDLTVTS